MRRDDIYLCAAQIIAFIATITLIFTGTWWQWVVVAILYFLGACIGGTITYHRLLAHRSWEAPKWFEYVGTLIETLMLSGSSLAWVAIHREHHATADTFDDPHSPWYKSILWIHFGSMLRIPKIRFMRDMLRSKFHVFVHQWYWAINLGYAAIIFALLGWKGLLYAWLVPACLVWQAGSSINSLNHFTGYRRFITDDKSTNHWLTGYLVFGEGWHNNHHQTPKCPVFGMGPNEFDLGYQLIRVFRKR